MTRRIEFGEPASPDGHALIYIDGEPQPGLRGMWFQNGDVRRHVREEWILGSPEHEFVFTGAYLAGQRQYDIELYDFGGKHVGTVPPQDVFVDDYYDQVEAGTQFTDPPAPHN